MLGYSTNSRLCTSAIILLDLKISRLFRHYRQSRRIVYGALDLRLIPEIMIVRVILYEL